MEPSYFDFFTELSSNISSLQIFIWSSSSDKQLNINNLIIQYKCDDGHIKVVISEKPQKSDQTPKVLQKITIKDKQLSIHPKDTCIFQNKEILTIRFCLDKTYLNQQLINIDVPTLQQKFPQQLEKLTCRYCNETLLSEKVKVKPAPSENWKEVIELWQCHDENFDQYLDPITKEIVLPKDTLLYSFNKLILHSSHNTNTDTKQEFLVCTKCKQNLGFIENKKNLLFVNSINELVSTFNFKKAFIKQLIEHKTDNSTSDILYSTIDYQHVIKVKILNNQVLIASNNETLQPSIKVLYNRIANTNQQIIELLKAMTKIYFVTKEEIEEIESILLEGQKNLPKEMKQFKNGLYELSYILISQS